MSITEKDLNPHLRGEMERLQLEWYLLGIQLQEVVDRRIRETIRRIYE